MKDVWKSDWGVWVAVALGVVLLLFASTHALSESPAVWYDEGLYTQAAANIVAYGSPALQVAPGTFVHDTYLTVGFPVIAPIALSYKLFGMGVMQGRGVMVLFTWMFVAAACVFVWLLFGRPSAVWTLLLLASFPVLYGNGKSVLGEVPGMFFLLLMAIGLLLLERSQYRSLWYYVLFGSMAGLCVVTKPIFILLVPALGIVWWFNRRSIPLTFFGCAVATLAGLVPVLLWVYLQFGGDATFAKQLTYYIKSPYAASDRLALAFNNLLQFFTQASPLYVTATMVAWVGAVYVRIKQKITITHAEMVLLVFCFCILAAYLRIHGWYRYFFPAQIVALLMFPSMLFFLWSRVIQKISFVLKMQWLPHALLGVLFVLHLYQLFYSSYVAQYYTATATAEVYATLAAVDPGSSFFLANVPEGVLFLPSHNYYQYIDVAPDMRIGAQQVPLLQSGTADYVVVHPDTYTQYPQLFTAYSGQQIMGRYLLLDKGRGQD